MTNASLKALVDRAKQPGLAFGVAGPDESAPLYPQEAACLTTARDARRVEFTLGRLAARRAMRSLGARLGAIPMAPDRSPIWPEGLVGSITHSDGLAVAVAGYSKDWLGLGIDLEPATGLEVDLIDEIARPEERADLGDQRLLAAKRLFSVKEAAYKAQYPITGVLFGFHALRVSWADGAAHYTDHPECAGIMAADRNRILPIRQWCDDGLILSLSAIPR